ncbi:DUF5686 and carboxypeptidase-like regulatory domain-containing protein [Lutibacter flavus]|uniref:CarboxypepD_reg-like domain-containing protein n=1 Tax=Lutibacter flavus TaxID=691689 RepID=A0A238YT10_9FLAO|nr:DUF5686 and carboxypeptidase-like regulatory domain-containing protein [Lutibacter flavus]SNR73831.1 CarboxypepD_reg-like domain-containing protein [Lutibacter flavus]
MKKVLLLIFLIPILSFSQNQIQGIVLDSKTNKPLPFASVVTNTNFGSLSDVDGKFSIQTKNPFNNITISYIGYKSASVPIDIKDRFITIKLTASVESLNEVLITAKENPALRIIRNTIKNKPRNNIEKSLSSFKFNTYNKILVTANPDSIDGKIDSVFIIKKDGKKEFHKLDSSNFKFKKEIVKQHMYISEKVSEFQFQKGKKKKEVVLASRMAGLKQPIYELLAITFQDFSFYNEVYIIAGTKYINPIADNALKHYNYKILDTINNGNGESILIYFKPKEKKEVLGIEGVLYIDTKEYAITKAIAELKGIVNVKATQNYIFKKKYNIWFPSEMNIVLRKGENEENISLFGGTVKFSKSKKSDSIINTQKNDGGDVSYFISKSVNSNISINTPVIVKSSSSTIQFEDNAHKRTEEFWNSYRTDTLTKRGEATYIFLDSVAEKEGVGKKINLARNVLKGYYPTKYFNLNLGKILNLNNYEGLRLGFGGETNSNFSNTFKIESYIAYGTKDKDFKYSIGASTRLNKEKNTWLGANFTNDLKEAAALDFIKENNSFSPINPRNLNIDKFYNYKTVNAFLEHDIQPNLETKIQFSTGEYLPVFNYQYISESKNLINYKLTTATFGLQYNPKNEYMNSPIGKLKIKNEFPQFTFQLTKSFDDLLNGQFDFTQVNLRILHKINRLRASKTTILTEGGIVFGDAPISHLFNATPNYTFKNPWVKRITFAGKNSFETMGYNEFISDKFVAIHIKHEFKPFKLSSKFKPQLSLITRAAIGDIKNPEYHNGLDFRSMNKGYFESGLEFNSLFKGFGLSSFYRYGAYNHSEWSDNLAVKLTFKLRLGF